MYAYCRISKGHMQRGMEMVMDPTQVTEQLQKLLDLQQEGVKGLFPGKGPTSGITCEMKEHPQIEIHGDPKKGLVAHVNFTFVFTFTDGSEATVKKFIRLVLDSSGGKLKIKECSTSPSDVNVKYSFTKDLMEPLKEAVVKQVEEQVLPILDENMCKIIKETVEKFASEMKGIEAPNMGSMSIQNMKEDEKQIGYVMAISQNEEGKSEKVQCTNTSNITEPACQMMKDATADLAIDRSMLNNMMKDKLKPITVGNCQVDYKDVKMMDSPEGQGISYTPQCTCKNEGDSKTQSAEGEKLQKCFLGMKIGMEGSNMEFISTERCDKTTELNCDTKDHEEMCHATNCKAAESLGSVPLPLPLNMGPMGEITMSTCKTYVVFTLKVEPLNPDEE